MRYRGGFSSLTVLLHWLWLSPYHLLRPCELLNPIAPCFADLCGGGDSGHLKGCPDLSWG